ncbi:hypothetical protein R5W24_002719 [Gemmata sp. JC717]|uniref:PsbP C-terminal domain-containing protein n=1 Tax=Gemmata algarum TaxID=2975278 RepID=A0ABU5F060_9BACT|nr:hypothetical protein [Gemmata algarum]MDY3553616.1 hypothetical protein [Gemmata algarum]MDY3559301.1 hypothetical protein [Gemmata algarum]
MRMMFASALVALFAVSALAEDKGVAVEWGGLKSTTPAGWKEETPSNAMRLAQFKLAKEKGDAEDAELALFKSPGGGTVDANLERQVKKFELAKDAKPAVSKIKVGKSEATYQDITGTLLKKFPPFDPNAKVTKVENYRQIYVIFEGKDAVYSLTLLGPAKTVEKHKKEFDEWVKNFK